MTCPANTKTKIDSCSEPEGASQSIIALHSLPRPPSSYRTPTNDISCLNGSAIANRSWGCHVGLLSRTIVISN